MPSANPTLPSKQNLESYDIINLSVSLSPLLILSDQLGHISSRLNDSHDISSRLVVAGGEVLKKIVFTPHQLIGDNIVLYLFYLVSPALYPSGPELSLSFFLSFHLAT